MEHTVGVNGGTYQTFKSPKGMGFVEKTGSGLSKERAVLPTRLLVWAPDIPLWEVTLTTALN
jgi:hypothetical protein